MKRHYYGIVLIFIITLLVGCQDSGFLPGKVVENTPIPPTATISYVTEMPPVPTLVPPEKASEKWRLVKQIKPEHKPKYAAFMNELFGVTDCGENFQPSFTADGGHSWSQPIMGKFCPNSAEIVNGRSIWMCNEFGVFVSKNGGQSLMQMYSPYDSCRLLSFADDENGWSSYDWNVTATTDGAYRWVDVPKDYKMGDIAALSILKEGVGYVLTYDGILWFTDDNGENWDSNDLGLIDENMRIANMDGRPPVVMRFQDEESGIIVLTMAGMGRIQFFSYHTADGGETWERHDIALPMGAVYLSHDGRFLTITELGGDGLITLLENQDSQ